MTKKYTEKDIQVLTDREHVRLRTQIYLGNTTLAEYECPLFIDDVLQIANFEFIPAVYKSVNEILDNSIDEFSQSPSRTNQLNILSDSITGEYIISDNGRGVPIGKHETGKYTPEVVFSSLRSGRNFTDNKEKGVIGMNGVGSSVTAMLSKEFKVKINRDTKVYQQTFSDGTNKISKPSITKGPKKTGTSISFKLDDTIFSSVSLPDKMMENRAIELAFTNPGLNVSYNKKKYRYNKGLEDLIKKISDNNVLDEATYSKFTYSNGICEMEFYVVFGMNMSIDEKIFTWVNSSLLFDGGIINNQFMNGFTNQTINHLQKQAKRQKIEINRNDVRKHLLIFGNAKISDPTYDAQSKLRLTGPNLNKEINQMISDGWKTFVRQNKNWLEEVLEAAAERHHASENKKAVKDHQKSLKKKVQGLIDATGRSRFECSLFITEGLSAASQLTEVRNPKLHGSLPLTGKINNIYGLTPAQLLQKGKITDLLSSIGLIPGQKALIGALRYGKIIIATDADYDGDNIFALLVNCFYQFWPELFDPNKRAVVYRLIAPNVVVSKGKKRIHYPTLAEYQKHSNKYSGWTTEYMKGLGSMWRQDWNILMNDLDKYLIPIQDDGHIKEILKLLFSKDADARKEWLEKT